MAESSTPAERIDPTDPPSQAAPEDQRVDEVEHDMDEARDQAQRLEDEHAGDDASSS